MGPKARRSKVDAAATVLVACSLAAIVTTRGLRTDLVLQDRLDTPTGAVVLAAVAAATIIALASLARRPSTRAYALAVLSTGIATTVVLVAANNVGWLAGTAFRPPLWVQAGVYGLAMTGYVALSLGMYRLIRPRSIRLAAGAYLAWVSLFTLGGVIVVNGFVDDGTYILSGGYTVFWDATWGVLMYATAVVVHEGTTSYIARRSS